MTNTTGGSPYSETPQPHSKETAHVAACVQWKARQAVKELNLLNGELIGISKRDMIFDDPVFEAQSEAIMAAEIAAYGKNQATDRTLRQSSKALEGAGKVIESALIEWAAKEECSPARIDTSALTALWMAYEHAVSYL
jgi:hypothetical protein